MITEEANSEDVNHLDFSGWNVLKSSLWFSMSGEMDTPFVNIPNTNFRFVLTLILCIREFNNITNVIKVASKW